MKKLLLIALLLGLLTFAFAACGNDDEVEDNGYENGEVTPPPGGGDDGNNVTPDDPTPDAVTRASLLAGFENWPAPEGYIVIATPTRIDQNILSSDWSNPQPLAHARILMNGGLATMSRNHFNEFFPNPMVMVDGAMPTITDNADGSRTYRFQIYTQNQFSDGTFITAHHYAGGMALATSPQWAAIVPSALTLFELQDRAAWQGGELDALPSVRIYSDSEFSLTIRPEGLPHVWERGAYMTHDPVPLHMYGVEAHDNGNGVFITTMGRDYFCGDTLHSVIEGGAVGQYLVASIDEYGNNVYATNADGDRIPVLDGIRYRPTVFAGPYMFDRVDVGNGVLELVANPLFPGTWDGYRPRIERLIWRLTPDNLVVDALAVGEAHIMVGVRDGDAINSATDILVGGGSHTFINYDEFGQLFVQFHTDTGPTQFREVRQAISFMLDRHEISEFVGRGFSTVAHGAWSSAWWWYQQAQALDLYDRITIYDFNMQRAMQLLEEGGWNYNADGSEWVHGSGEIRHKWVDEWVWGRFPEGEERAGDIQRILLDDEGEPLRSNKVYTGERVLMPLIINWMVRDIHYPLRDAIEMQLFDNLEYVGGRLFQERRGNWGTYLQFGYRQADRYEMHALGIGMATIWSPWMNNDLRAIPTQNWGQVDNASFRDYGERLRASDTSTAAGREAFVQLFIDYMEFLTYEAYTIPMMMSVEHDFIPVGLGNWFNVPNWALPEAIQRAYWR